MPEHRHDPDLIAGYADDLLDEVDRRLAERLLESCDDCRAELDLQRRSQQALASAPAARLTDFERARLHRGVEAAITPAAAPSPAPGRRAYRWMPALAAAAVVVVMVGTVGLLQGLGGGERTADTGEAVAVVEAPTAENTAPVAQDLETAEAAGDEGAAADTTGPAPAAARDGLPVIDLGIQPADSDLVLELERLRADLLARADGTLFQSDTAQQETVPELVCQEAAADALGDGVVPSWAAVGVLGDTPFEAYVSQEVEPVVVVLGVADCLPLDG